MKKEKIKALMLSFSIVALATIVIGASEGSLWEKPLWNFIGIMVFYPLFSLFNQRNNNDTAS